MNHINHSDMPDQSSDKKTMHVTYSGSGDLSCLLCKVCNMVDDRRDVSWAIKLYTLYAGLISLN